MVRWWEQRGCPTTYNEQEHLYIPNGPFVEHNTSKITNTVSWLPHMALPHVYTIVRFQYHCKLINCRSKMMVAPSIVRKRKRDRFDVASSKRFLRKWLKYAKKIPRWYKYRINIHNFRVSTPQLLTQLERFAGNGSLAITSMTDHLS